MLIIEAIASQIKSHGGRVDNGPIVQAGNPPFRQFQPAANQSLNVSVSPIATSVTALALSVNHPIAPFNAMTGKPRKIILTNTSPNTISIAFNISPELPSDASVSPADYNCGSIAPNQSCTVTITPGITPTSSSSVLSVSENSSPSLSIPIDIITYGSTYQSGYVFDIDDTTPDTQSIGGKAITLQNQAPLFPLGMIWASNGKYNCKTGNYTSCTSYAVIPGINELSLKSNGDACDGSTDGACNSQVIVNYMDKNNPTTPGTPVRRNAYAAGLCTAVIDDYNDWYLPAICEMGYFSPAPNTPNATNNCGPINNPLLQNMASNLPNEQLKTVQGPFWSSTEYSGADGSRNNAWDDYFTSNVQTHDGKEDAVGVRCVRALTQNNPF